MQTKYRPTNRLLISILALGLFSASTLYGPAYLKIGDIKGESQRAEHEEEIDIHDVQWSMSREAISGGGGAGKAVFKEMTLIKELDKSSPKLMEACATGNPIQNAVFTLARSSSEAHLDYLTITMENVTVTSVSINGITADGRPTEEVSLNYGTIKFAYLPQLPDGSTEPPVTFAWDVVNNTPIDPATGN